MPTAFTLAARFVGQPPVGNIQSRLALAIVERDLRARH